MSKDPMVTQTAEPEVRRGAAMRVAVATLLGATVTLAVGDRADARPGGGSSFRSSSSSSSSSGSSRSGSSSSGSSYRSSSSSTSSSGSSYRSSSSSTSSSGSLWGGSTSSSSSSSTSSSSSGGSSSTSPSSDSPGSSASSSSDGGFIVEGIAGLFTAGLFTIPAMFGIPMAMRPVTKDKGTPVTAWMVIKAVLGVLFTLGSLVFVLVSPWVVKIVGLLIFAVVILIVLAPSSPTTVVATGAAPHPVSNHLRDALQNLRARDPGFSRILLLDFVQALYTGIHAAIATRAAGSLRLFVTDEVWASLQQRLGPCAIDGIVIGSMIIVDVESLPEGDEIMIELEANYTKHPAGGPPSRYVVQERWTLRRALNAMTPEPTKMRVLSCPGCGAPADFSDAGACRYCQASFARGERQWLLVDAELASAEAFSTEGLGETVPEQGTDTSTRFHPALGEQKQAFAAAHGLPAFEAFEAQFFQGVVAPVCTEMYAAWSQKRWTSVRHLLGDRLWESQRFWMRAYEEKGLTNRLDGLRVAQIVTARIERDRDVEAITVRIFAACKDYTVDARGGVVGGSPTAERAFSEYWTFVRSTSARERTPGAVAPTCPSCGAPVDRMGEAGVCGYCNTKVSTGDFGWVLMTITQDEVYDVDE